MTDEQFQQAVIRTLARIDSRQIGMSQQVNRLEAAVIGNPSEGVDGLMTRMKVIEERTPGKAKRAVINGTAGVGGGGVVLLLIELVKQLQVMLRA